MSKTTYVSAQVEGNVLHITLRRPERRNAFDRGLADAALAAVSGAQVDQSLRVVVLRGEGGTLSAGADTSDPADFEASRRNYVSDPRARLMRAVRGSTIPVVAAIDGYALGLGMALAGASTFALATRRSTFGMPEASMGFFPFGVAPFLTDRITVSRVLEWALTARRIPAEEAHTHGLVTHLVEDDALERALDELVRGLASTPRGVLVAGLQWQSRMRERAGAEELIAWCEAAIGAEPGG
jgi:enoyl-CoA hydratase/carnithine racemase